MSEYPINSTARVYFDVDENPCTLSQMVKRQPEWAESRIREGEKALERVTELEQWQRDMVAKAAANSLDGYRELGQRAAKAEAERDALAAHVERLTTAAHRLINDLYLDDDEGLLDDSDRMREAIEAAKAAPTASLANLKAQWQAEAMETFASGIRANNQEGSTADLYGMARLMETSAAQFRRQSQEPAE